MEDRSLLLRQTAVKNRGERFLSARRGPRPGFDGLGPPLERFVLRYVRDHHAVEDLVQETFLRAHRNLGRYRGRASLKTWIFSIARNLCLDHLRAAGRSRLRLVDPGQTSEISEPVPPDPGRWIDLDDCRNRVSRALARLSPKSRELLILRMYDGLGYREIARRTGMAPAGVGTRIARALEGLTRGLELREGIG